MKMDKIAGSGNDEFYTPEYAINPLLEFIPKGSRIWSPFDTEESLIVNRLRRHDCDVTATHLESGHDFFRCFKRHDVIVSNPPYSIKAEVFERLFDIGSPFAMLVGVVGLFESEKRFSMFAKNKTEILWMSKRIAYFKDFKEQKPSFNPPFSSVWLCSGLLPEGNIFRRIEKPRYRKD